MPNGIIIPPSSPPPHDDNERMLMLVGVKREKRRWLLAFKNGGFLFPDSWTPEKIAEILSWRIKIAKEYAWDTMKNLCISHIKDCGDICASQMLVKLDELQHKAPPRMNNEEEGGPSDSFPPSPEDLYN